MAQGQALEDLMYGDGEEGGANAWVDVFRRWIGGQERQRRARVLIAGAPQFLHMLRAAECISSMHLCERKLVELEALPERRVKTGRRLVFALSSIMQMYYSTLVAAFRERADPMEALVVSVLMLCMQQLALQDGQEEEERGEKEDRGTRQIESGSGARVGNLGTIGTGPAKG